jgi:hypothetical protein
VLLQITFLRNSKKIFSTGIRVERDLCFESRKLKGRILRVRKEMKKIDKKIQIKVRDNLMSIKDEKFDWDEEMD